MEKYLKNYFEKYWENPLCEVCWVVAVNIHHIEFRSKYGKKTKHLQDHPDNLIALCHTCHQKAHWIGWKLDKEFLKQIHFNK